MIPAKAHSPSSRIISLRSFCRPGFFRQRWPNPDTAPQRPSGRAASAPFPGIFFRIAQCEYVIFSETPALPFSFSGNQSNDYKSKFK
ncbi:hypothetical protein LGN17_10125 [Burkholderia sp. AU30280]|nr:hypothetical protein [Burkholderia sp. AU30280]